MYVLSSCTFRTHGTEPCQIQLARHSANMLPWTSWAYPDTRNRRSVYSSHDIIFIRTHPTCKILYYNPDTRFAAPSDVHTSTHLPQNSTHTSRTTNIRAYAAGCIHARTHTRLPSYIAHVTNVCTLWPNVLVLVGGWGVVLVAGSSALTVLCVEVDSEEVRGGSPLR